MIYPTFEEYPNRYPNQHIISYVPDNTAFSYSVSDLQNYFSDKSLSTLLYKSDNPSGNFISRDDVFEIGRLGRGIKGITDCVDESFVDFAEGGLDSSLLLDSILDSYPFDSFEEYFQSLMAYQACVLNWHLQSPKL